MMTRRMKLKRKNPHDVASLPVRTLMKMMNLRRMMMKMKTLRRAAVVRMTTAMKSPVKASVTA